LREKPIDFLFETIQCRTKTGQIAEYTVVDCMTSALGGKYVVLQDDKGQKDQITEEEFFEIWVGPDSK